MNVIELPGVRIHSALSRMQTGTKVRYMQYCKTLNSQLYTFFILIYLFPLSLVPGQSHCFWEFVDAYLCCWSHRTWNPLHLWKCHATSGVYLVHQQQRYYTTTECLPWGWYYAVLYISISVKHLFFKKFTTNQFRGKILIAPYWPGICQPIFRAVGKISLAHKGNFSRDFDIKYDYLDHTRSNMSYLPWIKKKNKFDFSEHACNTGCIILISFPLQSSLKHPAESDFARQLVALSAGQVTVKLTVRPHLTSRSQVKGQRTLTDELQVEVNKVFALLLSHV